MSLGIVFKGPEGIVLAADSRVTLTAQVEGQGLVIPATFDNATKLLRVRGQDFVGAVTYGLGAIGTREPRTAHSYLPEFEAELKDVGRLPVEDFAKRLGSFFMKQWSATMPEDYKGPDIAFLVGGYDEGAPYGRAFEVHIPTQPVAKEWNAGSFGITYGGQREFVDRVIQGFDDSLPNVVQKSLKLTDSQRITLREELRTKIRANIPIQFLPLQDCVDLAIFLIRMTITIQTWLVGVRGVGGAIDVATITRTEGFKPVQQKSLLGERVASLAKPRE